MSLPWTATQLYTETTPRRLLLSYSNIYLLQGNLPSSITLSKPAYFQDPHYWLTQTYKNHSSWFHSHALSIYQNPDLQLPHISNYGVGSSITTKSLTPIWAHYATNTQWLWNQKTIYYFAQSLYNIIPGINRIYVTASSSLDIPTKSSDIDLIIHARTGFSWIVRILSKLYIKLQNRDVHSFPDELKLSISRLLGLGQVSKNAQQNIYDHKNRTGIKIDIGLVYSDTKILSKIFQHQSRHLLFHTSLLIPKDSDRSKPVTVDDDIYKAGTLLYEPYRISFLLRALQNTLKIFLYIFSLIFYPLFFLIYIFYQTKHHRNPNFMITLSTICFYPLIYKEGRYKSIPKTVEDEIQ